MTSSPKISDVTLREVILKDLQSCLELNGFPKFNFTNFFEHSLEHTFYDKPYVRLELRVAIVITFRHESLKIKTYLYERGLDTSCICHDEEFQLANPNYKQRIAKYITDVRYYHPEWMKRWFRSRGCQVS